MNKATKYVTYQHEGLEYQHGPFTSEEAFRFFNDVLNLGGWPTIIETDMTKLNRYVQIPQPKGEMR